MSSFFLALLLKPLFLLLIAAAVYPARLWCQRHLKEGRLKRVLLFRVSDTPAERQRLRDLAQAPGGTQGR